MTPNVIITCAVTGAGDTVGKHPSIPVSPEQIANSALEAQKSLSAAQLSTAIPLTNTVGPTMTNYYMIPNPHLPLLEPLRGIPFVGTPLADLLEPDMRVLVNLGYGSTTQGWSPGHFSWKTWMAQSSRQRCRRWRSPFMSARSVSTSG